MKINLKRIILILFLTVLCSKAYAWECSMFKILDMNYIPTIDTIKGGIKLSSDIKEYHKIIHKYTLLKFEPFLRTPFPTDTELGVYFNNMFYVQFKSKKDQQNFYLEINKNFGDKFSEWGHGEPMVECSSNYVPNDPIYNDGKQEETSSTQTMSLFFMFLENIS